MTRTRLSNLVAASILLTLITAKYVEAATVTLAWDPNTEGDLAGYLVSYGTVSRQYTTTIDVGNATAFVFTEPNSSTAYYFAVRAYNSAGLISEYSNEVVTTPSTPLALTNLSANRTSPQPVGTTIRFAATSSGGTLPHQYKWWIDNGTASSVGRNWSTSNTFDWTPGAPGSNYKVRVWARSAGNTNDAPENPSATLEMTFVVTSTANQPPVVSAGADQNVTLPNSATLSGSTSDDGQPNPPGALSVSWTKVSGPGTVVFGNANALSTSATFSAAGTYVVRLTASDGTLTTSDDTTITAMVNGTSGGGGIGTGLTGQYFNDSAWGEKFDTLVVTRTDPTVNFNWPITTAPGPGMQHDFFSARWTGQVAAPVYGTYTFTTISDDGVRLWIDGQLVIDNWTDHATTSNTSQPVTLVGGTRYNVILEFYDREIDGVIRLLWTPPGQTQTVIPQSNLFPSIASSNQPPTVSAGEDQSVTAPNSAALLGSASDDGQPNPPGTMTVSWTKVSGPGTVTFANVNALSTSATFSTVGTYVVRLTGSDGTLSSSDDATITVVSTSTGGSGAGLTGQYFNDSPWGGKFDTLIMTRMDPTINFNWAIGTSPGPGMQDDFFSIRWAGQVLAPIDGTYRFATVSDDGVRLWINGQLVIDNWTDHSTTTNTSQPIALVAGTRYNIVLEFYDRQVDGIIGLLWTTPGQTQTVIPQSNLFP